MTCPTRIVPISKNIWICSGPWPTGWKRGEKKFFFRKHSVCGRLIIGPGQGLGPEEKLVVLNPGGSHQAKRWPDHYWRELILEFNQRPDVRPALFGSPGELPYMQKLARGLSGPGPPDRCPAESVRGRGPADPGRDPDWTGQRVESRGRGIGPALPDNFRSGQSGPHRSVPQPRPRPWSSGPIHRSVRK